MYVQNINNTLILFITFFLFLCHFEQFYNFVLFHKTNTFTKCIQNFVLVFTNLEYIITFNKISNTMFTILFYFRTYFILF